jgi:hypothetical protein
MKTADRRCPGCGAVVVVAADDLHEGIYHYTLAHESWCDALTDEAA